MKNTHVGRLTRIQFHPIGRSALTILALACAITGCTPERTSLDAVLWTQGSVESRASSLQAYQLSAIRLDAALADQTWTAALEQKEAYEHLPPAIILDVDETVLDNSPYSGWEIRERESFSPATWNKWCNLRAARLLPGVSAFIRYAQERDVTVFYVTNRDKDVEASTLENLRQMLYVDRDDARPRPTADHLLMKREFEGGSRKGPRRIHVARTHRILLLIGDNFGDFVDDYKTTPEERLIFAEVHREKWGTKWIMLSNPMYGSWKSATYGHNRELSASQELRAKINALDAWDPDSDSGH